MIIVSIGKGAESVVPARTAWGMYLGEKLSEKELGPLPPNLKGFHILKSVIPPLEWSLTVINAENKFKHKDGC